MGGPRGGRGASKDRELGEAKGFLRTHSRWGIDRADGQQPARRSSWPPIARPLCCLNLRTGFPPLQGSKEAGAVQHLPATEILYQNADAERAA